MNRVIKFRAWSEQQNRFIPFHSLQLADTGNCSIVYYDKTKGDVVLGSAFLVLQQFTGMVDKHGKEIYEGDILSTSLRFGTPKRCLAEVIHDGAGFVGSSLREHHIVGKGPRHITLDLTKYDEYPVEIIGNIFENSDLLV